MRRPIGANNHIARLRAIRDIEGPTIQALLDTGEVIRTEAVNSIREGAIRGIGHVPSKPGDPPNADTGRLEMGIEVQLRASEKTVNVISTAPYSAELEFGSANVLERPFMRPALQKHRTRLVTAMVAVIQGSLLRVYKNGR